MNVKDKKQVMLALIVIVFLFVFFMLLGYFYTSNRNNSKRAYVLEEHYVETNNVYLNSSFPVSDALGKVYKGDADDAKQVLKDTLTSKLATFGLKLEEINIEGINMEA